jgi:cyclopropane-fatty-acyl-phospholipid synthase
MDGRIEIESDNIEGLIRLVLRNRFCDAMPLWVRMVDTARLRLGRLIQRNSPIRSKANVAHHYDLSNDLYRLFLDRDMQYSCAYFSDPTMSLDDAQEAKKAHIAAKLRIEPGMRVLDIGCGWGGMAITLARDYGAQVVGVTLSENQLELGRARVAEQGLESQVDLRLQDYRQLAEPFDRIVSVGMLEHVGLPHYDEYFAKVADLLSQDGIALIHTIGRTGLPAAQSEWINRYIFPGGYVPAMSELAPAIERAELWTCDTEVLRLHYAYTLRHWLQRFDAHLDEVRQTYDARFIRMWRYYLTICYLAFEEQAQAVFQFQLARRRDAVPITRDYLYATGSAPQAMADTAAQ